VPRLRPHPLDLIALGLLALALILLATGALPLADAKAVLVRILPLLAFLATVIVLAELTAAAELFDVVAARLAIASRGSYPAMFLLCTAFASVTTIVLNLDTTAILLTPVMLALARKTGLAALPLAMTTVWLANTASLLLPVSNLTNLLAMDHLGQSPVQFASRMWPVQLTAIALTMICLWYFFWRPARPAAPLGDIARAARPFTPPAPHRPADRPLFAAAATACVLFVISVLLIETQLWLASTLTAAILLIAFAVRRPRELKASLFPWRLLLFVTGLFLVVETASLHGLSRFMDLLIGDETGPLGLIRAAAAGAGLSNVVNNLPAYVAGEAVIAPDRQETLIALLIGTNIGPLITPWASLATLLWFERCHAAGLRIPVRQLVLTGAVLAVTGLAATVAVLAAG
jgi:arsenical pump membrane protein